MEGKEVIVYSTPTCTYCNMVKEFFKENGVEFVDYNVGTDIQKRQEMLDRTGQMGVPVIVIGEDVVVGFDKSRLSEILGI